MFPARLEGIRINESDGTPTVRVAVSDITDIQKAEEALRESEEKLRATIGQSMDGILITDGDFNIIEWNAAQTQIYGNTRGEMLGKPLWEFQFATMPKEQKSPGLLEKMKRRMLDHRASPDSVWMNSLHDYTVQCGDGPCKTVQISTFPIVFRNSILFGSISRDITETKRAEDKLLVNEQKYRDIFENSVVGSFQTAPGGRMINVNSAFAHMYGFIDAAEMLAADLDVGSPPYANPEDRKEVLRLLVQKGKVENYETLHCKRDGTRFWVSITARTTRDNEGNVLLYEGTIIDITGRKVAEEALRVSNAFLDSVIENIPVLVFLKDARELRFVRINRAVEELTGYFCSDLMGKNDYDFVPKEQADFFVGKDRQVLKRKEIVDIPEEPLQTRDKGMRTLQTWKVPLLDDKGEPEYLLGISVDITERKRAEEALRQANKKLTLLSGITRHDINNKLTVLRGYLAILEKKQSDPTLNDYFVKVSTAAQQISSMIQFTKEYEEIGVHAPAWQDCRTLVDTAAKDAPLGQVTVKNDFPAGTEVFADPLVVKVCYNLMDNAVRYGGKITTIRFSSLESGDDHLVVCEDDGDGIPVEEKEKIFERGFGKNTGLGLALSREVFDITGITIRETGEPGKGARFEMTVPKGAWRMNPGTNNISRSDP
jgi:PAS domain S-box-containing protein